MSALTPLIRYFGGKTYASSWLVQHFPIGYETMTYVEPFVGAGSVLLRKRPSQHEVINDICRPLVILHKIVRDCPEELQKKLSAFTYCKDVFLNAKRCLAEYGVMSELDIAVNEFILYRMSYLGLRASFSRTFKLRRGMNACLSAWLSAIDKIPLVSNRLKNVEILNQDALSVIAMYDSSNTFFYLDPPYVLSERSCPTKRYVYEYTDDQHKQLALVLSSIKGKFMISGYDSQLYNELYHDTYKLTYNVFNSSGCRNYKNKHLTEVVWCNYNPQRTLF